MAVYEPEGRTHDIAKDRWRNGGPLCWRADLVAGQVVSRTAGVTTSVTIGRSLPGTLNSPRRAVRDQRIGWTTCVAPSIAIGSALGERGRCNSADAQDDSSDGRSKTGVHDCIQSSKCGLRQEAVGREFLYDFDVVRHPLVGCALWHTTTFQHFLRQHEPS
jgi:hypothetical protein